MKYKILLLIVILTIGLLFACKSKYMVTAKLAIRDENNPDKAIENLQKEIESNPTNVEAYLFISKIYGQYKQDYVNSYYYAKKTLEISPQKEGEINEIFLTCWAELYNQGLKNFTAEDFENALKSFKLANEIFPDSIKTKIMIANVYTKLDSSDMATQIFIEIAKKLPNDTASRERLAETYFFHKDYDNAIKYYQELVNIEPENIDWLYNIAVCYSNLNNQEKVLEYYKKAVELDPQNKEFLYKIAHTEFNNQNYEDAVIYYEKIIEIDETELDAIEFITRSLLFLKDYENLVLYGKKWIALEPDNEEAQLFINLGLQNLKKK